MNVLDLLLNEKVIAAAFGAVGGAVAVLVAPWVRWSVERRKLQWHQRKEQIDKWHAMIARVSSKVHQSDGDFGDLFLTLYEDTDFLSLEPHLTERTKALLNGNPAYHEVFEALLTDVAAAEKKWKIS